VNLQVSGTAVVATARRCRPASSWVTATVHRPKEAGHGVQWFDYIPFDR